MSDKSGIEWTDSTWPIVQGCDPVSPGCAGCYAVPLRLAHNPNPTISAPLQGLVEHHKDKLRFTGKVALREDRLDWPLKWKKPRKIFVPSHGDIFHKDVPDAFLDQIFSVMTLARQHTFQVLTKRPERMRDYLMNFDMIKVAQMWAPSIMKLPAKWPLPNVWAGVSCERQEEADERIPLLLQTPAAVRFISAEPLLGAIDLTSPFYRGEAGMTMRGYLRDRREADDFHYWATKLDWVIAGGESGPNKAHWQNVVTEANAAAASVEPPQEQASAPRAPAFEMPDLPASLRRAPAEAGE